MYLSAEDRERLCEVLVNSVSTMEQFEFRIFFLLMIAMLHDHRELEKIYQKDVKKHLRQLRNIEGSLRQMAEQMNNSREPEKPIWQ